MPRAAKFHPDLKLLGGNVQSRRYFGSQATPETPKEVPKPEKSADSETIYWFRSQLFGRIWERLGIDAVLSDLLKERAFEFAGERAVFVATLHRLFVSGSDRDCTTWMSDYDIPAAEGLDLHHFYRAMAWLGEEIEEKAEGALAPRCVKDLIEEKLFERRRDLFTDLSAVFMDTTSLSFYGEGGESLGQRGYSKDYRPDLNQMILGVWSWTATEGRSVPRCGPATPPTSDAASGRRPAARSLPYPPRLRGRRSRHDRAETIAELEARSSNTSSAPASAPIRSRAGSCSPIDEPFVPLPDRARNGETHCSSSRSRSQGRR